MQIISRRERDVFTGFFAPHIKHKVKIAPICKKIKQFPLFYHFAGKNGLHEHGHCGQSQVAVENGPLFS